MELAPVKERLRPDTSVLEDINAFIASINERMQEMGIRATCVAGGSVAKGTFIKGDFDVDLFVRFDPQYDNLSDKLEEILEPFHPERVHGSRDYFQIKQDSFTYEVVPVLDIDDPKQAENVTDMSPMHVGWVKEHLSPGQEDQIRLLKQFCKAAKVYGAESYIRGFSGHVIDILVIHYGSFEDVLKASAKWKPKALIDPENHYKGKRDVLFHMNQSKIQGPMIVIDPILPERNAASALSSEKFKSFREAAREYLKHPSEEFFDVKTMGKTQIKKEWKRPYIISVEAPEGKEDVVGSKILKAFKFMRANLRKRGFSIKESGWSWNRKKKALMWFVFGKEILDKEKTVQGPPADMKDHVKDFKKKYEHTYEEKGKIFASVQRKNTTAKQHILELVKKPYFSERVTFKDLDAPE